MGARSADAQQARVPRHHKTMRLGLIMATITFGGVFYGLATLNTPKTEAIEPSEFNAGYLIDDSVFYNANTMTVEEIQKLLDEKSPACDMWGTGLISGRKYPDGTWVPAETTRAQYAKVMREKYGKTQYHDPPYVCINKYYENPETHQTLYETQGVATAGMKSVAQIIYDVAQEYSINPQVLLVMIKKESLVWGDNWPLSYEYNTVMGYGCPDNAPCNEAYYGFYNQVQKAAWQLNYYREHPNAYRYKPGQNNNIQYHPNIACGTKQVYLENIATTSLYIYTPYTPNDAALRAYPGTGDDCSSYGNRNFYMFFREWFGSTGDEYINIRKSIESYYKSIGENNSVLGSAKITDAVCSKFRESMYCKKEYSTGYIIATEGRVWDVSGGVLARYEELKGIYGDLGFPTSSEIRGLTRNGAVQAFDGGNIYWHPEYGAWDVSGGILTKYFETGTEWGYLGYPKSGEQRDANGIVFQEFEGGKIYWTADKGAWVIMI